MEEKIEKILKKTGELYQKYGIRSVTMDDVARELGISKKTLYQYFADKNELVDMVIQADLMERDKCFKNVSEKGRNAIDEMVELHNAIKRQLSNHNPPLIYDLQKYYPETHKKVENFKQQHVYNRAFENMNKGIKEGLYRSGLNVDFIAKLQVLRWVSMLDNDLIPLKEFMETKLAGEMLRYHLYGIVSKKGIEYIEKNNITFD